MATETLYVKSLPTPCPWPYMKKYESKSHITFSTHKQNPSQKYPFWGYSVENSYAIHGRRKDFSRGGALGNFSKIFLGGGKVVKFFPLKTKKTNVFAKIVKIQGDKAPWCYVCSAAQIPIYCDSD